MRKYWLSSLLPGSRHGSSGNEIERWMGESVGNSDLLLRDKPSRHTNLMMIYSILNTNNFACKGHVLMESAIMILVASETVMYDLLMDSTDMFRLGMLHPKTRYNTNIRWWFPAYMKYTSLHPFLKWTKHLRCGCYQGEVSVYNDDLLSIFWTVLTGPPRFKTFILSTVLSCWGGHLSLTGAMVYEEIQNFSLMKIHLKISSVKCPPFFSA